MMSAAAKGDCRAGQGDKRNLTQVHEVLLFGSHTEEPFPPDRNAQRNVFLQLDDYPIEGRNALLADLLQFAFHKTSQIANFRASRFPFAAALAASLLLPSPSLAQRADADSSIITVLRAELSAAEPSHGQIDPQLIAFYRARDFAPAWTGNDRAREHAQRVLNVLQRADEQGLQPENYLVPNAPGTNADSDTRAQFEIAMSRAFLRYISDVRLGRFKPATVYDDAELPSKSLDTVRSANAILSHSDIEDGLAALPPSTPAYRALVAALDRYRNIAKAGGWPLVTLHSRKALMKRLAIEDPASASEDPAEVSAALMRYETRNGFEATGALTPDVVDALNVPVQMRIQQIKANLERQRWMPDQLESRYIVVNPPDQSVEFVRNGKVLLHSKVVVGKPQTATPILRTEVKAVVINPPWNIPDFITARALLPHLRKNSDYLQTRNMILAGGPADDPFGQKIDWRKVTATTIPYQVQQPPGPDNALGTVMLDMPNTFDVYLHDTPEKNLFALDNREKSNGCIRVQQIKALTSLVMTGDAEDGTGDIDQAIATGKTQRIKLSTPMPVYLLYWTALPQDDGTLGFRPDRYNRDQKLIAMMNNAPAPKPAGTQPAAKDRRVSMN
jgi:murein L,D-transpeptidase YcbB/YkuD